jgi:hypothetical protein
MDETQWMDRHAAPSGGFLTQQRALGGDCFKYSRRERRFLRPLKL